MTRHPCGCFTATDPASGVLRSASKCPKHRRAYRDPATLGEAYYAELGALDPDAPARYVGELTEALGELPKGSEDLDSVALEVGCGASPYVRLIEAARYEYVGLDPSPWVAGWLDGTYGVHVILGTLEERNLRPDHFSLILAAHVLEHLDDAPGAIVKLAGMLTPGGELWVVVPDDSDPLNPDHMWFFTPDTLRACVERAGLEVVRFAVRRYVKHENFIYLRARKPA